MNYLESDAPEVAAVAYGPNEVRSWDLVCVSTPGGSQFPSVLLHPPPLALRSSRALANAHPIWHLLLGQLFTATLARSLNWNCVRPS